MEDMESVFAGLQQELRRGSVVLSVLALLKENGLGDRLVIGGGIIPDEDIPALKKAGMAAIFTPGTPTGETIAFIKNHFGIEP